MVVVLAMVTLAPPARAQSEAWSALDRGDAAAAAQAARAALAAGSDDATSHTVLALVAELMGDDVAAWDGWVAAARSSPALLRLALHRLDPGRVGARSWRERAEALLALAEGATPADAALACSVAAELLYRTGETERAATLVAKLGFIGDWLVVAGFENDQMKGYDVAYGPERDGVDPAATYQGQKRSITWRRIQTLDERGRVPHIQLQSPNDWSVAYMATWVHSPDARDVELRLTSAEPVKAWVNGAQVVAARQVEWARLDHIVAPARLEAGWNLLLVKSCQDTSDWETAVRLTGPDGAPSAGLRVEAAPQQTPVATGAREWSVERIAARYEGVAEPLRPLLAAWALSLEGLPKLAAERLDTLLHASRTSPAALLIGAYAAWDVNEDEKMLDRLAQGVKRFPDLPAFLHARARYFRQKERLDRAIEDVAAALRIAPGFARAQALEAELLRKKGWREEGCRRWRDLSDGAPDLVSHLKELASCAKDASRMDEARRAHEAVLALWPTDRSTLTELARLAERRGDHDGAITLYERQLALTPYRTDPYIALGNVYRVRRQWDRAASAYLEAAARDPEYAWPHQLLGEIAMEQGLPDEAAAAWRRALELNPDEHVLWERVERLEPDGSDMLSPFVPTDERIDAVLAGADGVKAHPNSSYLALLDHEAMQLNADGSIRRVVTTVTRIRDEGGRDRFSTLNLPRDGHVRVLRAYVVDPKGARQEVTSLRNRQIRFQDLRPGSTIVMQYRHDALQQTFLNNHWHGVWFFQQDTGQTVDAEWVVVMPAERTLRVHVQGPVTHRETLEGDRRVYRWSAKGVPPLQLEQQTVPLVDLAALVAVSTLPDWEFFVRWEWSMVEDSLRMTPDLQVKAKEVVSEDASPQQKVDAVYRFVANGVRYVQDYEERIAGVRPHPASLTYERRYGDCKDKVVLMMMLLRSLGVEARFAMLSTFTSGRLVADVPSQQFNHAIVYVPEQPGIPAGRFYDPTAEHLDTGNLRWDDQGQTALVIWEGNHAFIPIPFDPPELELQQLVADIQLAGPDDPSRVEVVITARGRTAAGMRKALTNDETARRMIEGFTCGYLFPGGRLLDTKVAGADTIDEPVRVTAVLAAPNLLKVEDRTLRMDVLDYARVASKFGKWKERRQPLWFGPPETTRVTLRVKAPPGTKIARLPAAAKLSGPCLDFSLAASKAGAEATIDYTLLRTCPQLAPGDYEPFRDTALRISRALAEPVVFRK